MRKKKTLVTILIAALVMATCTVGLVYAATDQEKLDSIKDEKKSVESDLSALSDSIKSQQADLDDLQADLDAKLAEIDQTQAEIDQTTKDMQERKDGLDGRLRAMYKNGSVGYLDIILGSSSLSEFLSNIELIQQIYRTDQETLATLEEQSKKLEEQQKSLKEQQEALNSQKAELQSKQSALKSDQASLQSRLDELDAEAEALNDKIYGWQDDDKIYEGGIFCWPSTSYYITSYFGERDSPTPGASTNHGAIDIGASYGSPIYAAADGTVILSQSYGGYGNCVSIDHGSGISTLYGHASRLVVSKGQNVTKGQVIAYVGSTGISTGPHLHFEVRINGVRVDPLNYY